MQAMHAVHSRRGEPRRTAMSPVVSLIGRYIDAWNEPDPARRRDLIRTTYADDAGYRDPVLEADGHEAIDAMIVRVHERFPGCRFRLAGTPDAHHDRVRFAWTLAPDDAPPVVEGVDFATFADGRLTSVTGFFDRVAAAKN
jgi:hypothetical protein